MCSADRCGAPVREVEHVWIPLSDGIRLAARLWLPVGADSRPVPAIIEYIPYRKRDLTRLRDERNHRVFAAAGYASIRIDMRGSGDSEGRMTDMYMSAELDDAIAVIEWIASRPWCDGRVGMFGQSWGGTASLQAASRRPAALKAILACCATNNRFDDDIHHMGGCLLTDTVEWGAHLPAILASPPDPQTVGEDWRSLWMDRLKTISFPLENWVRHEWRDEYWRHGAVDEDPDSINCPILAVGGWSDRYSNTVMSLLTRSKARCWGIIGPWGHHYPFDGSPGPAIGFQEEAIRWWDRWLRGVDNGIDREPRLRVWRMEYQPPEDRFVKRRGNWIAENTWPSTRVTDIVYRLGSGGVLAAHSGEAAGEVPEIPVTGIVGLGSGDTGYFGRTGGLPLAQQQDDSASLIFESAPLDETLDLLGSAVLEINVLCDKPVATLAVRLNDVPPEGDVARVSYGIRNLALDDRGLPDDALRHLGRRRCRITLPNTAYRFNAGHRIRLSLSDSYWPQVWPSPEPACIAVETDTASLTLPRRDADHAIDSLVRFASPTVFDDPNTAMLSAPKIDRSIRRDASSGELRVTWTNTPARLRFAQTGLEFGSRTHCVHTMIGGDNESAHCRVEHRLSYRRDEWNVEVVCTAELSATKNLFQPTGHLVVRENGSNIFEQRWSPVIPRTCS